MTEPHAASERAQHHAGRQWATACGLVVGVAAAGLIAPLIPAFGNDLARAHEAGVVSLTVLDGYSQSRDLITYLTALILPIAGALSGWRLSGRPARRTDDQRWCRPPAVMQWRIVWALLAALIVLLFNANYFVRPNIGWRLLAEEGQHLAGVQTILNGGVFGTDLLYLYGPLMIYPLVWLMQVAGPSILVMRTMTFICNLLAYAIVLCFLRRHLSGWWRTAVATGFFILTYSPYTYLSLQSTYLRPVLGLMPVWLVSEYVRQRDWRLLAAAGGSGGLALLFSHEVGLAATAACAGVLGLDVLRGGRRWTSVVGGLSVFGAATALPIVPWLLYFWSRGALRDVALNMVSYPSYVALGFGSLPFPTLAQLAAAPWDADLLYPYCVIAVYVFGSVQTVVAWRHHADGWRWSLQAGLLIFGILLFRVALGRSDPPHVHFAAVPAWILLLLYVDRLAAQIRGGPALGRPAALAATALVLTIVGRLFCASPHQREHVLSALTESTNVTTKFTIQSMGVSLPELPRGQVFFHPDTVRALSKLYWFLSEYTEADEPVVFYPNEAAYYFLFDRPNPTRFAIAYFAITHDLQREWIAEVAARAPRFVIYSKRTWRPDGIQESVQIPDIVAYLEETYEQFADYGDIVVLTRREHRADGGSR